MASTVSLQPSSVSSRNLTVETTENAEGTVHSYTREEKRGIVDHINSVLKDDPQLQHIMPIDPETDAIFEAVKDGKLTW